MVVVDPVVMAGQLLVLTQPVLEVAADLTAHLAPIHLILLV
jgi:hypothetical protein